MKLLRAHQHRDPALLGFHAVHTEHVQDRWRREFAGDHVVEQLQPGPTGSVARDQRRIRPGERSGPAIHLSLIHGRSLAGVAESVKEI